MTTPNTAPSPINQTQPHVLDGYWDAQVDSRAPTASEFTQLQHLKKELGRGAYGGHVKAIATREVTVPGPAAERVQLYHPQEFADTAKLYRDASDAAEREQAIDVLMERNQKGVGGVIGDPGYAFSDQDRARFRKEAKRDLAWAAKLKDRDDGQDPLDVLSRSVVDYRDVEVGVANAKAAYEAGHSKSYKTAAFAGRIAKSAAAGYGLGTALPWLASHISSRVVARQESLDPRAMDRNRKLARLALFGVTILNVAHRMKTGADADGGIIDQALGHIDDTHGLPTNELEDVMSTSPIVDGIVDAVRSDGGGKDTGEFVAGVSNDNEEAVKKVLAGEHTEDKGEEQKEQKLSGTDGAHPELNLADQTVEIGEYKKDKETGLYQGTAWYHVDHYAREHGIRDQLTDEQYQRFMNKAVDQVLEDNNIGGKDATAAERREAARGLSNDQKITIRGSAFSSVLPEGIGDSAPKQDGAPGAEATAGHSSNEAHRDETKDTLDRAHPNPSKEQDVIDQEHPAPSYDHLDGDTEAAARESSDAALRHVSFGTEVDRIDKEYPNPSSVQDELGQKYPNVSSEVEPIAATDTQEPEGEPTTEAPAATAADEAEQAANSQDGSAWADIGKAVVGVGGAGAATAIVTNEVLRRSGGIGLGDLASNSLFTERDESAAREYLRSQGYDEGRISGMDGPRVVAEANSIKLKKGSRPAI